VDPRFEAKPSTTRHATLLFELGGRPFPLPLLHGSVLGEPTWMLVDTGANSHVIAGWLARKVGLQVESHGDIGTDHAGREIQTSRVAHPAVAIDDWGPLVDAPMLVTEIPAAIEKLGIGAFISPQSLGEGAAIVLDLRRREMHSAGYSDAERELGQTGHSLSPAGGIACEDTESPIKGLAYVIPATIDHQPTMLLIDSGAERTDLLIGSHAAHKLAPRSVSNKQQLFAASGRIDTRTLRAASLTIGEWAAAKDVDLIPGTVDTTCPRDGVVAMDVLKYCVLVLGPESMSGRCDAP
jgi:hypothetical protein